MQNYLLSLALQEGCDKIFLSTVVKDIFLKEQDINIIKDTIDCIFQVAYIEKIHLLFDTFIQFIKVYMNENSTKYILYEYAYLNSMKIEIIFKIIDIYCSFLELPIIPIKNVFRSVPYIYYITLRMKEEEKMECFNKLLSFLSLNLPNSIQELVILFQYPIEQPNYTFRDDIKSNLPCGKYEQYYVECDSVDKIIFNSKIDNKDISFIKNEFYFECESNEVYSYIYIYILISY